MEARNLLPTFEGVRLNYLSTIGDTIVVHMNALAANARCRTCGNTTERIHSHYQRTLADLPWAHCPVRILLQLRKFFCDNPDCKRRIFTEPIPDIAARYARKTKRLQDELYLIGYSLGGRAGAREAEGLGREVGPDTLLRRVREVTATQRPHAPKISALGVDDWAFRKGHHYGTILVDLEHHELVDLLPDRSAESLATWLKGHPEIEILSRDRAGVYADGARQGAPQAQQVADRWHVLRNLGEAIERLTAQHTSDLREAAQQIAPALAPPQTMEVSAPAPLPATQQRRLARQEKRHERYDQIQALRRQGWTQKSIAQQVGVSLRTVKRFLSADAYPERSRRRRQPHNTDRYDAYLRQRLAEGCHNVAQLYREVQQQGYSGSYASLYKAVASLAPTAPLHPGRASHRDPSPSSPAVEVPSSRSIAWWLQGHLSPFSPERQTQQAFLEQLYGVAPVLKEAGELAQEFIGLVQDRSLVRLDAWLETASTSVCTEMRRFAQGLRQDWASIQNAVSLEWSNGQVEGQVNRLKMIKRQMYGRANFDLLRARVRPMAQAA
jgi:transposase